MVRVTYERRSDQVVALDPSNDVLSSVVTPPTSGEEGLIFKVDLFDIKGDVGRRSLWGKRFCTRNVVFPAGPIFPESGHPINRISL